jgi:hypothetical protein
VHLRYRVEFYSYVAWPWLTLGANRVTVPAHGAATVLATLRVPGEAVAGGYQGLVVADYARPAGDLPVPAGGGYERPDRRLSIPVAVNVSARYAWQGSLMLGNSAATPSEVPYPNGAVRGLFDWSWRPESGDWRFFFLDNIVPPPSGTYWLVKTGWSDPSRQQTDIDSLLYGPTADEYSNAPQAVGAPSALPDPGWYGPYTLGYSGGSDRTWQGDGRWTFDTATGTNEDWVAGPAAAWPAGDGTAAGGLTALMLHNVLYGGAQFEVPFTSQVSSLRIQPAPVTVHAGLCLPLSVTPQVDLIGLKVAGVGLAGPPEVLPGQPVRQDDAGEPATASLRHEIEVTGQAIPFTVSLSGPPSSDLDLYLLYDANHDGQLVYPDELVGESAGSGPEESVALSGVRPAGHYEAWVHGYKVPGGTGEATLTVDIVQGTGVTLYDVPTEIRAGQTATLRLCASDPANRLTTGRGTLLLGPGVAPFAVRVPLEWRSDVGGYGSWLPQVLRYHYQPTPLPRPSRTPGPSPTPSPTNTRSPSPTRPPATS